MLKLDHLIGYPVKAIAFPHKQAEWKFEIIFEGGRAIRIYQWEDELPTESEWVGASLQTSVENEEEATMYFGGEKFGKIVVPIGKYSLLDAGFEYFPPDVENPRPVEPQEPSGEDEPTEEGQDAP